MMRANNSPVSMIVIYMHDIVEMIQNHVRSIFNVVALAVVIVDEYVTA